MITAQAADGSIHQFPEGTNPDVVDRVMKDYAMQRAARSDAPGALGSAVRNAANTATFNVMPMIAAAGDAVIPLDAGSSHAATFGQRYQENLANQRAQDAAARSAHPIASLVGSVGGGFLNPVARALGPAQSLAGAVGQGAALGGAYGLGGALTNQEPLTKGAVDTGIGALTGGAIGGAFHGLANLLMPPPKTAASQALEAEGVTPTIGQSLGGSAQRAEDALTSTPILGDAIKNRQLDAMKDFNKAVYNRVLDPLGVAYPANGPVGNEGVQKVADAIDNAYSQAYRGATITDNPALRANLQNIVADAGNVLPTERTNLLQKNIDRLLTSKFDPKTGQLDSDLLENAKNWFAEQSRAGSSATQDERNLASAYGQIVGTIKNEVANSDPNRAALLNAADKSYANYIRLIGASASNNASGKEGIFTPNQLGTAVRAADLSAHKNVFAKGGALLQDLAQAGQQTLTPTVPDSGTPFRSFVSNPIKTVLSLPAILPGAAAYTPTGQDVMRALLFGGNPKLRAALSQIPRYATPGALGVIGSQAPAQATP